MNKLIAGVGALMLLALTAAPASAEPDPTPAETAIETSASAADSALEADEVPALTTSPEATAATEESATEATAEPDPAAIPVADPVTAPAAEPATTTEPAPAPVESEPVITADLASAPAAEPETEPEAEPAPAEHEYVTCDSTHSGYREVPWGPERVGIDQFRIPNVTDWIVFSVDGDAVWDTNPRSIHPSGVAITTRHVQSEGGIWSCGPDPVWVLFPITPSDQDGDGIPDEPTNEPITLTADMVTRDGNVFTVADDYLGKIELTDTSEVDGKIELTFKALAGYEIVGSNKLVFDKIEPEPVDEPITLTADMVTRDGNVFTVADDYLGKIELTDTSEVDGKIELTFKALAGYEIVGSNKLVFDKLTIVDPFAGVDAKHRKVMLKPGEEPRFLPAPQVGEGYILVALLAERDGHSAAFTFTVEPNDGSICTTEFYYDFRVIGSGQNQNPVEEKGQDTGDGTATWPGQVGDGNVGAGYGQGGSSPAEDPLRGGSSDKEANGLDGSVVELGTDNVTPWFTSENPVRRPWTPEVRVDPEPLDRGHGGVEIGELDEPVDEDIIAAGDEILPATGEAVVPWIIGIIGAIMIILAVAGLIYARRHRSETVAANGSGMDQLLGGPEE